MRRAAGLGARASRIESPLRGVLLAAALAVLATALAQAQPVEPPGVPVETAPSAGEGARDRPAEAAGGDADSGTGRVSRAQDDFAPLDEAELVGPPAGPPIAGEELESRTRALASRMRCPVCQGLPIADSPSASALAMVSQTRDLLARGYTEKQVLDYFVRAYGEFVLLEPTTKGFNLVVWLLPVAGLLLGAALIARRLRSTRRAARSGADPSRPDGDDDLDPYLERVRSEIGS
ncbi:MAG TPA: cytochrome c-type biogenesis protein [Thermoanaerobaculia bacterium]|nr:cytochrome c-type biogenesis protein [Thermoanaerobaculia bacterium]